MSKQNIHHRFRLADCYSTHALRIHNDISALIEEGDDNLDHLALPSESQLKQTHDMSHWHFLPSLTRVQYKNDPIL